MEWQETRRQTSEQLFNCYHAETEKTKGMIMKSRYVELYHDESGERFLQLFKDAQAKRHQRAVTLKQTLFWMAVGFALLAVLGVKLWTMGAIVGVK